MKQIGSGILKRGVFVKFLFVFFVSAFSVDVLACENVDMNAAGDAYIAAAPNDPVRNYTEGYARFCQGREWSDYIGTASDLGHVTASYFLGEYHRKDKDFNSGVSVPTTQEDYDAAIFYYERAATNIENMSSYPRRPDGTVHEAEAKQYISVRTFLHLISLYFDGYSYALGDMLKNDVSYTDTIQVLENMKSAADRCLKRPSLSVWGERQKEVTNSKKVICQAQKDFAVKVLGTEQVIGLEFQRIEIAKHCADSLSECEEHQAIIQEIVQASQEMNSKVNSVPKI